MPVFRAVVIRDSNLLLSLVLLLLVIIFSTSTMVFRNTSITIIPRAVSGDPQEVRRMVLSQLAQPQAAVGLSFEKFHRTVQAR